MNYFSIVEQELIESIQNAKTLEFKKIKNLSDLSSNSKYFCASPFTRMTRSPNADLICVCIIHL